MVDIWVVDIGHTAVHIIVAVVILIAVTVAVVAISCIRVVQPSTSLLLLLLRRIVRNKRLWVLVHVVPAVVIPIVRQLRIAAVGIYVLPRVQIRIAHVRIIVGIGLETAAAVHVLAGVVLVVSPI